MIDSILIIAACIASTPALIVSIQVFSALRFGGTKMPVADDETSIPATTILMPAHNEAGVISTTLTALMVDIPKGFDVVVVADNCTDDTANIAAAHGAHVIERQDLSEIGKSYALAFGQAHLGTRHTPPEVVIILDADCVISAQDLTRLSQSAVRIQRPAQARDILHQPANGSAGKTLTVFAIIVKNWVRPLGFHALGLPCQLMGTGMAFPWSIFKSANLANGSIVEDVHLGFDLAADGHAPEFVPSSLVESAFPEAQSAEASQRTRWEHGHLQSILALGPRSLWRGIAAGNIDLIAMSLDLMVPPLALYLLLMGMSWSALLASSVFGIGVGALAVLTIGLCALAVALLLAWRGYARDVVSSTDLFHAIGYILRKIPLYIKAVANPQKDWVRTDRDEQP